MESVPYNEIQKNDYFIRTFEENTPSEELKWHFDDENRIIIPLKCEGWKLQIDESLPITLEEEKEYFIPVDVYHRIIKGTGDLIIKLYKMDKEKKFTAKYNNSFTNNENFSDNLMFHINNNIPIHENIFRYGSDSWCNLIQECKKHYEEGNLELNEKEIEFLQDDPGKIVFENGVKIILNTPFINTKKDINKKYYVNVLTESGNVKTIYFNGD